MRFIILIFCFIVLLVESSFSKECNPQKKTEFTFQRGYFYLVGNPANFDPCHSSVDFTIGSSSSQKQPLVIGVHGGGGKRDTTGAIKFFNNKGFSTLVFDAYEMNGITDYRSNMVKYGNPVRQQMIFPVTVGAIEWAIKQKNIDTNNVYIWGISNGATVVANIAAVFDKKKIKAVFSEAPTNVGMGMPDDLKAPLVLIFGKKDNYGSTKKDGWRWLDKTPCRLSVSISSAPKGNTFNCNQFTNQESLTENHISWFDKQKSKKADIQLWFYEDAAHSIFAPRLDWESSRTHPKTNITWYTSVGAKDYIKEKYKKDLLQYITNKK